ncbi:hypothetical protein [Nocardia rhamnosiphila]
MARVVCVHGIGQQVAGSEVMVEQWLHPLNSGLALAGGEILARGEVTAAFYGDLFRPPGQMLAAGEPWFDADDVEAGFEQELLEAWWVAAAATDQTVSVPDDRSLGRVPRSVQVMLEQLADSRFFAGIALRSVVGNLKQVRRYLTEPRLREQVRDRVRAQITPETRVVVGHSLGSVVAYETLCSMPGHPVRALVTLGSPLGIPNLVFDRLDPAPEGGIGVWPGSDGLMWSNIADAGDVVALVKRLAPLFGDTVTKRVRDGLVHNDVHAHSVAPYLTDKLTGEVVAEGLYGG